MYCIFRGEGGPLELAKMTSVDSSDGQEAFQFDGLNSAEKVPEATPFTVSLLALNAVNGLGHKGIRALVSRFRDDLQDVWDTPTSKLTDILARANVPTAEKVADRITMHPEAFTTIATRQAGDLAKRRVWVIPPGELPPRLKQMPDPPLWLFVQGRSEVLYDRPAVAIVGTRDATDQGRTAAQVVAELAAAYPIVVISGLAPGIDEAAHAASLQQGATNVAFLGHGHNVKFPASSEATRLQIVRQGGATVSEYLPGERYSKSNFVERNRLQAALSDIVIPVEAKLKGGTAHTYNFAKKYARDVVGIRWKGVSGLVSKIEQDGYKVFDIATSSDRKRLDTMFRNLAEEHDHETFSLSLVARVLKSEYRSRNVTGKDLDSLFGALDAAGEESVDDDA